MVNLPPDQPGQPNQPDASRPVGGGSPRDRILDFDELLALVLAFLGIGSILWWGLSRNQGLMAQAGLLQRRVSDSSPLVRPEGEEQTGQIESPTFGPSDRPRASSGDRSQPDLRGSSDGFPGADNGPGPGAVVPRQPAATAERPVPAVPATAPAAPPTGAAETTQPLDISDVPPSHWAYPFIKPMFDQGYLPDFPESGFQPDQPLTRAELAALLSQAFGNAPREGSVLAFSDVPSTYWAAPAIANAVAQGFMNGYPEGDFRPDQAVPRYEVLVSLVTGLGLKAPPNPDQTLKAFVDLGPLPEWAKPKVAAAAENSLVVDYPNPDQLQPARAATRAEIVAMIHQALVQRGKLPPVDSKYAVP
ncbi:S-layer homology domain-containing protein [Nodosilinea nodulosa]|uniref:S-layer homology domain-containing protein n=1 Tax=Nodosilinea nodulosa TaxID=416001 RepID=UPI00031BFB9B|nr:S-layer homology domain-containing protein [Nodosilinea nodulosa]